MTEEMTNVALELSEIEKQVSAIISENIDLKEENKQAKNIIKEFMRITEMIEGFEPDYSELIDKAEVFINKE